MELKLKLLHPTTLPSRSHRSAGMDLYSPDNHLIAPGETRFIPLGIATEFSPEYVALLWDRSGMGKKGIHRFGGVIDADYRGEWAVCLHNSTAEPYAIAAGEKIIQVLFQRIEHPDVQLVHEVSHSSRGEGGFGSTG